MHVQVQARLSLATSMCGRFTNKLTWTEIVALYNLALKSPPHNMQPRYNICPTDPVDCRD
jgi:putative SOS response-associated peptidase YedK